MYVKKKPISAAETAFLAKHGKPNAGTAQRRPRCRTSG
jgi:hypothetical protein